MSLGEVSKKKHSTPSLAYSKAEKAHEEMAQGIVVDMGDSIMNNLKRKYNIYAHSIPKINLVGHGNDRWRLRLRLQKKRRLYRVEVNHG